MEEWSLLDGKEREISECLSTSNDFSEDGSLEKCTENNYASPRRCYMQVMDKTKILRAKKRMEEIQTVDVNKAKIRTTKRSRGAASCDRTGIFPDNCVICSKEKFLFEKHL